MPLVVLLHALLLAYALKPKSATMAPKPALSFTVTLNELSASPNSVSSAASQQPAPVQEREKEPMKVQKQKTQPVPREAKKPVFKRERETRQMAALAPSAQAQTAVLAPVTPARFDAAYLNNPAPSYPPLSRRMGEEGKVLLDVHVSAEGLPLEVKLKKTSGHERLDDAAVGAVRRWRFITAQQGGQPISSWVVVPINFVLEK